MNDSDHGSLTELLLDLTENEDLLKEFLKHPEDEIKKRRLERYVEILVPIRERDPSYIRELRKAVREEVTGKPGPEGPVPTDDCIICGVRVPPPPPPPP